MKLGVGDSRASDLCVQCKKNSSKRNVGREVKWLTEVPLGRW